MQNIKTKDLAAVLELTPRRVLQLVAEGVLHRDPDGSFRIPQAFEDYYRHYYHRDYGSRVRRGALRDFEE